MALPLFAKDHASRIAVLEETEEQQSLAILNLIRAVEELEKQMEKKKPGRPRIEPENTQ